MTNGESRRAWYGRLVFGLALLGGVIWLVGPDRLLATISRVQPGLAAAAVAVYSVGVLLRTARWRRLCVLLDMKL